jgi:serine protease 16
MAAALLVTAVSAAAPWHLHLGRSYAGPPKNEQADPYEHYYPAQHVDHFACNEERTSQVWSQRFFADTTLWGGPGFPVFLQLGGEGPSGGTPGGLQRELALSHQAALITLEHRFYGKSRPTPNMSSSNLKHLSAEQALADAAKFIEWWSETHGALNSSWVAWGGSYSGQLASWLRLRYPASVVGAVAFSAPILAQLVHATTRHQHTPPRATACMCM